MDCTTVRERIEADPAQLDIECASHVDDCTACAAYAERVRNAEWLIHEALRFDVAAVKQNAARPTVTRTTIVYSQRFWGGIAATLVVGLAVWFGSFVGPTAGQDELAAEVVAHWYEEPGSWTRTDVRVSPASLEEVVGEHAEVDIGGLGLVSYAMSCFVRGEWVPHLVMQGELGPVMLLLLPHESVTEPVPLELPAEGLSGVIIPLGEGSIAVMGEAGEAIEPIRERLNSAVEWSI